MQSQWHHFLPNRLFWDVDLTKPSFLERFRSYHRLTTIKLVNTIFSEMTLMHVIQAEVFFTITANADPHERRTFRRWST